MPNVIFEFVRKKKEPARRSGLALNSGAKAALVHYCTFFFYNRCGDRVRYDLHLNTRIARPLSTRINAVLYRLTCVDHLKWAEGYSLTRNLARGCTHSTHRRDFLWESHCDPHVLVWLGTLVYNGDPVACHLADADWIFQVYDADVKRRCTAETCAPFCVAASALAVGDVHTVAIASWCAGCQC